jgi:hypothetical protein
MIDPRKFAGVASQCRKDNSSLVQYVGNMADEAFFWTCCPRHIEVTSLNCEACHYPYGEKLVVCAVLPDLERQHLVGVGQSPGRNVCSETMHSLVTNPLLVILLWARSVWACVFPCQFFVRSVSGIFVAESPYTISETLEKKPGLISRDNSCKISPFLLLKNLEHFHWSRDPREFEFNEKPSMSVHRARSVLKEMSNSWASDRTLGYSFSSNNDRILESIWSSRGLSAQCSSSTLVRAVWKTRINS